jgi:molybdopterin converting factor small subunit
MAINVKLPTQLRASVGGASTVPSAGATVGEVLAGVYAEHPDLRERICDDGGELRRFVNVYVGGEDIRYLDGLDTPVSEGGEVQILPAVAGG